VIQTVNILQMAKKEPMRLTSVSLALCLRRSLYSHDGGEEEGDRAESETHVAILVRKELVGSVSIFSLKTNVLLYSEPPQLRS